jgi:hypothetical protein
MEIAARVQIASEQGMQGRNTFGLIDRLGAPAGADWSLYPVSDRPTFALAGLLAKPLGVFGAINVLRLLAHLLGAASFYGSARLLRWSPAWAAAGGLLFSFAVFNQQWTGTLSLGWTFALPPAVVLFQWIAGRGRTGRARSPRLMGWLAVACGLWLGGGNPYFTFIASQLLVFALALQWFRDRTKERLRVGVLFLAALSAGFVLTHAPWLHARLAWTGEVPIIERNYAGTEIYALKPIRLLLPPPSHRVPMLAELSRDYRRKTALPSTDPPSAYLGLVGVGGLLILAAGFFRHATRRRPIPDAALAVLWVVLLSCVGGFNSMLAFTGFDIFRGSNRFSIFILIWSLFAALGWLRCRTAGRPRLSGSLALAVVCIGLFDQVPRGLTAADRTSGIATLAADRATARRIAEATEPSARVFLRPAMPFPEAAPVGDFPDYDHFRLFLASPSLRFSYGGLRGSLPERWGRWTAKLPPHTLVTELERRGFSVLVLDRRARLPQVGPQYLADLRAAGAKPLLLPESPNLTAFLLNPAPRPVPLDTDDPRYGEPWGRRPFAANEPQLFAVSGWYGLEGERNRTWRWAVHEAATGVWWDGAAVPARLTFNFGGVPQGELKLYAEGREIWRGRIVRRQTTPVSLELPLRPGMTRFEWRLDGRSFRPGGGDTRELGFYISNLAISVP